MKYKIRKFFAVCAIAGGFLGLYAPIELSRLIIWQIAHRGFAFYYAIELAFVWAAAIMIGIVLWKITLR